MNVKSKNRNVDFQGSKLGEEKNAMAYAGKNQDVCPPEMLSRMAP